MRGRTLVAALGLLGFASVGCTPTKRGEEAPRSTPASTEPAPAPAPQKPPELEPAPPPEPEPAPPPEPVGDCPPAPAPASTASRLVVPRGSIERCSVDAEIVAASELDSYADDVEFVIEDYQVSLIVPLGEDGCFGRIPELSFWQDGTEEASLVAREWISSRDPVDAYVEMSHLEQYCEQDGDQELCGLSETERIQIVITGLADGSFLVTEIGADSDELAKTETTLEEPKVEVTGTTAVIEACGGRTSVELPASVATPRPEPDTGDDTAGPVTAEQAKAAGKRCNDGWVKFGEGDLAGATLDVDAALRVLERAVDERGRRSLGACLYNRGRIAEARDDHALAIELYRRSLAVRQNATVQSRLDSLSRSPWRNPSRP